MRAGPGLRQVWPPARRLWRREAAQPVSAAQAARHGTGQENGEAILERARAGPGLFADVAEESTRLRAEGTESRLDEGSQLQVRETAPPWSLNFLKFRLMMMISLLQC